MHREILGLSVPTTKRERGFLLAGFGLGVASGVAAWLIDALLSAV